MATKIQYDPKLGAVEVPAKNHGSATIGAAATSVTVTHNLGDTPDVVMVVPTATWGTAAKFWVSDIGATTFKINVDAAPGANLTFDWVAWSMDVM